MDYDNGFILQKTMVSTNRSLDWSLLRSSSARLLPSGRKNYHHYPQEQSEVQPHEPKVDGRRESQVPVQVREW